MTSFLSAINKYSTDARVFVLVDVDGNIVRYAGNDSCLDNVYYNYPQDESPSGRYSLSDANGFYEGRIKRISAITKALPSSSAKRSRAFEISSVEIELADPKQNVASYAQQFFGTTKGLIGCNVVILLKPKSADASILFYGQITSYSFRIDSAVLRASDVFDMFLSDLREVKLIQKLDWPYIADDVDGKMFPIVYGQNVYSGRGLLKLKCLDSEYLDYSLSVNRDKYSHNKYAVAGHKITSAIVYFYDSNSGEYVKVYPGAGSLVYDSTNDWTYIDFSTTSSSYVFDWKTARNSEWPEVFADVYGKPDSSGTMLFNPAEILNDFIKTHTDYLNYFPLSSRDYIFHDTFAGVRDKLAEMGISGAGCITEVQSPKKIIEQMCADWFMRLFRVSPYFNSTDSDVIELVLLNIFTARDVRSYPILKEDVSWKLNSVNDILEGSLDLTPETDKLVNVIHVKYAKDYSKSSSSYINSLKLQSQESIDYNRREFPLELKLNWIRDSESASTIASLWLWRFAYSLYRLKCDLPLPAAVREVATFARMTFYDSSWLNDILCYLEKIKIDPTRGKCECDFLDVELLWQRCGVWAEDSVSSYSSSSDAEKAKYMYWTTDSGAPFPPTDDPPKVWCP